MVVNYLFVPTAGLEQTERDVAASPCQWPLRHLPNALTWATAPQFNPADVNSTDCKNLIYSRTRIYLIHSMIINLILFITLPPDRNECTVFLNSLHYKNVGNKIKKGMRSEEALDLFAQIFLFTYSVNSNWSKWTNRNLIGNVCQSCKYGGLMLYE